MNRRRFLALAAAAVAGAALPAAAAAADLAVSSPDGLRLRRAPSADAETVTVLPDGLVVRPSGAVTGGWVPVDSSAGSGWVAAAYLAPSIGGTTAAASPPTGPRRGATTDAVRVRGGPCDPWQGKYVTIQRAPGRAGPTGAGLRNPSPADYA